MSASSAPVVLYVIRQKLVRSRLISSDARRASTKVLEEVGLQGIIRKGKRDTLNPGEEDQAAEGEGQGSGTAAAGARDSQAYTREDFHGAAGRCIPAKQASEKKRVSVSREPDASRAASQHGAQQIQQGGSSSSGKAWSAWQGRLRAPCNRVGRRVLGRVGPRVTDTTDGCNSECMIAHDEAYCCCVV